jgi:hypothetical protein
MFVDEKRTSVKQTTRKVGGRDTMKQVPVVFLIDLTIMSICPDTDLTSNNEIRLFIT